MSSSIFVEYLGNQIDTNVQMNKLKEIWKEQGGKVKDLKDVKLYINAEQNQVYYVINEDVTGSFEIVK